MPAVKLVGCVVGAAALSVGLFDCIAGALVAPAAEDVDCGCGSGVAVALGAEAFSFFVSVVLGITSSTYRSSVFLLRFTSRSVSAFKLVGGPVGVGPDMVSVVARKVRFRVVRVASMSTEELELAKEVVGTAGALRREKRTELRHGGEGTMYPTLGLLCTTTWPKRPRRRILADNLTTSVTLGSLEHAARLLGQRESNFYVKACQLP